jgi:NAD(P)H-dependent FMN reductase
MKVLGIVASPRKSGNTDILVRKVLMGAKERGAETDLVYLNELNIKFCQGCGECAETGVCVQEDDMQALYKKLDEAERLVFGTPVYMNNLSGQMKVFADRCGALMEVIEQPQGSPKVKSRLGLGKKAILVTACGCPLADGAKATMDHLKELCSWLSIETVGEIIGCGLSNVGDAEKKRELLDEAFSLGCRLAE